MKHRQRQTHRFISSLKVVFYNKKPFLFMVLATILFTNCKQAKTVLEPTIINGSLDDKSIEKLYVYKTKGILKRVLLDSTLVESQQFRFSINDLEEGSFFLSSSSDPAPVERPAITASLYLIPNDTLTIDFAENNTTYRGSIAHLQEFNSLKWDFIANDSLYKSSYQPRYEIPKRNKEEAISIIESIREKQLGYLKDYFSDKMLPEKFNAIEVATIEYQIAFKYFWFLRYHKYMTEKETTFEYLAVDSSYYHFLQRIDLNAEINPLIYNHNLFLESHLNDLFFRSANIYDGESPKAYMEILGTSEVEFKTNWIIDNLRGVNRDLGFYTLLNGQRFKRAAMDSLDLFYKDLRRIDDYLKENFTDSSIVEACTDICDAYFRIEPGAIAPPLALPDSTGTIWSLDKFKGKVVYIDFWGTWCGPCIAAIPDHRELQKKFAGQDVIFLNVAMEAGEENIVEWKKFQKENDFPGVHIVAEHQFNNKEIQPFMISSAPTYMLIDKEGRIVNTKAPKPIEAEGAIRGLLSKGK